MRYRLMSILTVALLAACGQQAHQPSPPAKVPVRSEVVAITPFQARLTLLGRIEPAARLELRSPAAGRIRYPRRFAGGLRTGERVADGELLFEIDNDDVRLRLAEAELSQRLAETELERARRGVEGGFLPAAELKQREIDAELAAERLASARLREERLRFKAPAGGVLRVERVLAPGSEITAGDTLVAELAGEGMPRIDAWAAAADRDRLRAGLEVECALPGSGKVVGRGRLAEISRQVDRSGTLRLVVTLDEDPSRSAAELPLPGEGVELELLLDPKAEAITVPQEALIVDGGVASVFVLEPEGAQYRARRRLVQAGSRSDGRVEVLDGLREGERVAVGGAEFLADGLPATEARTPDAEPPAADAPADEPAAAADESGVGVEELPAVADEEDG